MNDGPVISGHFIMKNIIIGVEELGHPIMLYYVILILIPDPVLKNTLLQASIFRHHSTFQSSRLRKSPNIDDKHDRFLQDVQNLSVHSILVDMLLLFAMFKTFG